MCQLPLAVCHWLIGALWYKLLASKYVQVIAPGRVGVRLFKVLCEKVMVEKVMVEKVMVEKVMVENVPPGLYMTGDRVRLKRDRKIYNTDAAQIHGV